MSKDLVVNQSYEVSNDLVKEFEGMGLGAGEEIDSSDILVPKISLMQAMSKPVSKGKAKVGLFYNSVDLTELGDNLEMIVLDSYKNWQEFRVSQKGQDEYIGTKPFYGNENLEYDFKDEEGKDCKRIQVLGFYVLLLEDIKNGMAFPYAVDFKKSSKKAGRELTTYFAKLRSAGLPSFAKVFSLGTELVEDEYTYYVKTVNMGRDITKEELGDVKNWLMQLKERRSDFVVDDSEEKAEAVNVEAEVINDTKF